MISLKELLSKVEFSAVPKEHQSNIMDLLEKINKIRTKYGQPMTPTNSYRTMQDHLRIYKEKGITDPKKIPMKSNHLFGKAVDISDPNRKLQAWCKINEKYLEEVGLWMEDFSATATWCHFQTVAPVSGKRFFMP